MLNPQSHVFNGGALPAPQIRRLNTIFESFVRALDVQLASTFPVKLDARVVGAEQQSFSEFTAAAAAHACRLSLSLDPYPGNAILELGSELVFALLGALLGGSGEPAGAAAREITEIERNILNEALPMIVDALRREWARFAEVGFDYKWAATDPQAIPSADEPVIVFRAGALTLVVPAEGIKRMQAAAPPRSVNPRDMSHRTLDRLRAAQVRVEARLEGAGMLIRDLLELKQGQVIAFSHPTDRPVDCAINGRSVYKGEMVTVGSKVAVQIGAESGEGTGG